MEYVKFGSAGVKVSRLALGLGLKGQRDKEAAERMISHTLDLGINLIDCANVYGLMDNRENAGSSEVILGKALKDVIAAGATLSVSLFAPPRLARQSIAALG